MASTFLEEENLQVHRENLYEVIANRIENMIFQSVIRPGDKLPSEQDLADKFGVSRNVIREALKVVKERELVIQKNGDGSYVSKPDSSNLTRTLNRIVRIEKISFDDVFEIRLIIEPYAASKVAGTISTEQITELKSCVQQMIDTKNDITARAEADLLFHQRIIEYLGNPFITTIYNSVMDLARPIIIRGLTYEKSGNENGIQYHKRIIESLIKQDEAMAGTIMADHIRESILLCNV